MYYVLLFVLLSIACITDVLDRKIPNILVLTILVLGLICSGVNGGAGKVIEYVLKVGLYIMLLYPLFKIGVLGAGDVKLLSVLEGFFSWNGGLSFFCFTWIAAAVVALVKLMAYKDGIEKLVYLFSYLKDVFVLGKWQYYFSDRKEALERGRYVHMTIPMLIALCAYIGGFY